MNADTAWKIAEAAAWSQALSDGVLRGSPADLRDGFIHLSAPDQLAETAAHHFAGRDGLVLLKVDLRTLGEAVRWEPSRGGALFPHLYGDLTVGAVTEARALAVAADGALTLGEPA